MSIQLEQDERDYLERIVRRPMKPTRRQKALALLRLAEGDMPEQAAQHAGIPIEEVAALASEFIESGLAGVGLDGKPKTLVRLVRPGLGVRKYYLSNGVTLADFLRRSKTTTAGQAVYVDGLLAEETMPLRDGSVVMIVPQPRNAAVAQPWRATIPSFQDDEIFEQYRAILKARRKARARQEEDLQA
jgi:hypothetical protein